MNLLFVRDGQAPFPTFDIKNGLTLEERRDAVIFYKNDWAFGCDLALETEWYSKYGLHHFLKDDETMKLAATYLHWAKIIKNNDSNIDTEQSMAAKAQMEALEAKMLWTCLTDIRKIVDPTPEGLDPYAGMDEMQIDEVRERHETVCRLEILEAIIRDSRTQKNPVAGLAYRTEVYLRDTSLGEVKFWDNAGQVTAIPDWSLEETEHLWKANVAMSYAPDTDKIEIRQVMALMCYVRLMRDRVPGFPHNVPLTGDEHQPNKVINDVMERLRRLGAKEGGNSVIRSVVRMFVASWDHRIWYN